MRAFGWILGLIISMAPHAYASCLPSFPYADGWLGGDFALSIPVDTTRSVWLFADTFVGAPTQRTRANSAMVSNTIGISTCHGRNWSIRYYHGKDRVSGDTRPIFDSGTDKFRFWPLDGFIKDGRLYVFLVEIAITGRGAFDFKEVGGSLAEVTDPQAAPDQWSIRYHHLSSDAGLTPGVSAVVQGRYVYLYTVADRVAPGKHQTILARLPLEHLDSPSTGIEYLDVQGTWKQGLNQHDAKVLVDDGTPDFSVRFHLATSKWVMVQTDPRFPAHQIGIRTSDHLEGPWSSFRPRYEIPKMRVNARSSDVFCYAAREHIEFASPNSMMVTYACNSLSFGHSASDMTLYRPVVIDLPLK